MKLIALILCLAISGCGPIIYTIERVDNAVNGKGK